MEHMPRSLDSRDPRADGGGSAITNLLVYAVGDSVMWGEGLYTENKFALRVASNLALARGLTPKLKLLAHCGAKIRATREERIRFTDLFPHLFGNERERSRFILAPDAGPDVIPDETPTDLLRLHGEIARPFPTIPHQLRSIPEDEGAQVDVLLVTGGANDLDFESVFQKGGNFLDELDHDYYRIFHDDIIELLALARKKCPKALIVLTGYYSAFSISSRRFGLVGMQDMFLELSKKKSDYQLFSFIRTVAPHLGFAFDELFGIEDRIEHALSLAQATSEAGESRVLHWMRTAVSEINEKPGLAAIRGPGVAFAAPGFSPENCMFASESFIWQQYMVRALDDDVRDLRSDPEVCRRIALRDRMQSLLWIFQGSQLSNPLTQTSSEDLVDLHNKLDGPVALRAQLLSVAEDLADTRRWRPLGDLLREEINRIDITRISSIFHPNRQGAARYVEVIYKRVEELRRVSVRERLLAFLPPEQRQASPALLSVGKTIRRFGFDAAVGVKACLAHAHPDVLGLVVHTHPSSDVFSCEVFLDLGAGGSWKLRHLLMKDLTGDLDLNPHFQPGTRDFFSIDVAGQISIGDITGLTLKMHQTGDRARWELEEEVILSIDGCDVLNHTLASPQEVSQSMALSFPYPVQVGEAATGGSSHGYR
jgi:hypothetical protein